MLDQNNLNSINNYNFILPFIFLIYIFYYYSVFKTTQNIDIKVVFMILLVHFIQIYIVIYLLDIKNFIITWIVIFIPLLFFNLYFSYIKWNKNKKIKKYVLLSKLVDYLKKECQKNCKCNTTTSSPSPTTLLPKPTTIQEYFNNYNIKKNFNISTKTKKFDSEKFQNYKNNYFMNRPNINENFNINKNLMNRPNINENFNINKNLMNRPNINENFNINKNLMNRPNINENYLYDKSFIKRKKLDKLDINEKFNINKNNIQNIEKKNSLDSIYSNSILRKDFFNQKTNENFQNNNELNKFFEGNNESNLDALFNFKILPS